MCVGGSSASSWQKTSPTVHISFQGFQRDPIGPLGKKRGPRGALASLLGQQCPPSAPPHPKTFVQTGYPKSLKVPCRCHGKPAIFSASIPGAGPKDRHFISKCTATKPGKATSRRDRLGEQLADDGRATKAFS